MSSDTSRITPVEVCERLAREALDELDALSPDERPFERAAGAEGWLLMWLSRAHIEGQRYVTG